MKKTFFVLLLLFVVVVFAFATGDQEQVVEKDDNVVKIALIVENTIDDKGWCQAMHDGILEAQEKLSGRIEYAYSEKMLPVDAGSACRQYVAEGFDIIIGHGAQYGNTILEMAEEYPNVTFAYGTSSNLGPDNVFTYMPESEETGYLNGMIAASLTKTNKLGVVGPVDGGDAARYNRGFVLGALSIKPNVQFAIAHTGSFSDYIKAGSLAQSQIKNGVDILTGSSQQALGAFIAVADFPNDDIWWVGQDLAQMEMDEGYKCISASSYNYRAVIVSLIEKHDAGIIGGEVIPMNFNNGGFYFAFNPDLKAMYEGELEKLVMEKLEEFKATPKTLDWKSVDYTKLKAI